MALFSKKESASAKATADEEDKSAAQYQVVVDAPKGDKVLTVKIPTILVQPRISEKAGHLVSLNKYVFEIAKAANKVEVKKAVESAYKVRVTQVNIVNNQGKKRNFGRISGRTQAFKKAIVTLKKGDKIEGLTDVV